MFIKHERIVFFVQKILTIFFYGDIINKEGIWAVSLFEAAHLMRKK